MTCVEVSAAAAESLAGTATRGSRWLLVEVGGMWGRDAVGDTVLPEGVRAALQAFDGRVLFVRRSRNGVSAAFLVETDPEPLVRRTDLDSLADVAEADLSRGTPVDGNLTLVCAHGRRDPCCARLGVPLYDALGLHIPPERLWQASHLGGHRFAGNVLVVPLGVQLGRVSPERAGEVASALEHGRIPLDLYRGRTLYSAATQAAEVDLRVRLGLDRVGDVRLQREAPEAGEVEFAIGAHGELIAAQVEAVAGPDLSVSCGAEPEGTTTYVVHWLSDVREISTG